MDNTIRDQQIDPPVRTPMTLVDQAVENAESDVLDELVSSWLCDKQLHEKVWSVQDLMESQIKDMDKAYRGINYDPSDSELYCAITNLLDLL